MSRRESFAPLQDRSIPVGLPEQEVAQQAPQKSSESPWSRLIEELQACWTRWPEEIDDLTIASYLAGVATAEEQAQIEQLMQRFPALQMAIQTAQEALEEPTPK